LQPSLTLKPAEGGREVADIDGKASLVRFVLDLSESCTFESRQRQSNDRCLCGYVIVQRTRQPLLYYGGSVNVDIHIGVGFSVARSDEKGSARALKGGTSGQSSHALFVFALNQTNFLTVSNGNRGNKTLSMKMRKKKHLSRALLLSLFGLLGAAPLHAQSTSKTDYYDVLGNGKKLYYENSIPYEIKEDGTTEKVSGTKFDNILMFLNLNNDDNIDCWAGRKKFYTGNGDGTFTAIEQPTFWDKRVLMTMRVGSLSICSTQDILIYIQLYIIKIHHHPI